MRPPRLVRIDALVPDLEAAAAAWRGALGLDAEIEPRAGQPQAALVRLGDIELRLIASPAARVDAGGWAGLFALALAAPGVAALAESLGLRGAEAEAGELRPGSGPVLALPLDRAHGVRITVEPEADA